MIKVDHNILVVSIVCCTALIMFFYYQYNTPYNQCVKVLLKDREPKYFNDRKDALLDIMKTADENNYYRLIDSFVYQPVAEDKVFNIRDIGYDQVKITRKERLEEIVVSVHSLCAYKTLK